MLNNAIPKAKVNAIRRHFIDNRLNPHKISLHVNVSYSTVLNYIKEFKAIQAEHPDKLTDMCFFMPKEAKVPQSSVAYNELITILPALVASDPHKRLVAANLFKRYRMTFAGNYSESQFNNVYLQWKTENNVNEFASSKVKLINEEDRMILHQWRASTDHRKWQKAVVILESFNGRCLRTVAEKVEATLDTVELWVSSYKANGLARLERKAWTLNEQKVGEIEQKMKNLNELIHQTPSLHGINRTAWRTHDLATVYQQVYGQVITASTVWNYLDKQGYRFRKAREILTSPDPNYKEKLAKVTAILSNLGQNERFFSIDEMGPCGIRNKGGWSFVEPGEHKVIKSHQKAKAYIICTAALELSTNQVSHFYSLSKNTDEMIKLMELLLMQYHSVDKIYLSWDAASWHASKKLKERIREVNSPEYRAVHHNPMVELAPLPASAQFLNVIESVFSGLAKAVIHNSDYQNADECKRAIDEHFAQRNAHFLKLPKRAGNRIWGQELVSPEFSPAQHCRDPKTRYGGKRNR